MTAVLRLVIEFASFGRANGGTLLARKNPGLPGDGQTHVQLSQSRSTRVCKNTQGVSTQAGSRWHVLMVRKAQAVIRLNQELRTARSRAELVATIKAKAEEFDSRHVATAIYTLAMLPPRRGNTACLRHTAAAVECLADQLAKELVVHGFGHRSLSNVCWAVAKLSGETPLLEAQTVSLSSAAAGLTSQMNSQGLSNTCWALAVLRLPLQEGASFWRSAAAAMLCLDTAEPQHLATLLWAMATSQVEDRFPMVGDAVEAIVRQACSMYKEISPQNLAICAWSFARLAEAPEPLLTLLSTAALERGLEGFQPQEISTAAWAFARIAEVSEKESYEDFRLRLVRAGCARLPEFTQQGLSNLAFALSSSMPPPRPRGKQRQDGGPE
ncbi:unnamed protein product [Symbiodinium sp. CCMP2592]|nr:unnamed protein product [Symbiodinium sp. CCMP2592]